MNQQQIDLLHPKPFQGALRRRGSRLEALLKRRDLGHEEDVAARDARAPQRLAYLPCPRHAPVGKALEER